MIRRDAYAPLRAGTARAHRAGATRRAQERPGLSPGDRWREPRRRRGTAASWAAARLVYSLIRLYDWRHMKLALPGRPLFDRNVQPRTHVPDDDRRQPAEARLARRAEQAVGAVAARRRRARGRQARRDAARAQAAGGLPASTSSATASSRASTSSMAFSSSSTASTSPGGSRWASATTATRRWCRTVVGRIAAQGRVHETRGPPRARPYRGASSSSPCPGR